MHYYSHNIGDYRKDTVHLSLLEHGIYRQLLDTYYLSEKPLTLDHADLMRTHCARTADEVRAVENVLKDFFFLTDKGYIHKRCDVEIEAFHSKSVSARESAKARWDRVKAEKDANALRTQCEGNANHKPLTNNQEPEDQQHCDQQAESPGKDGQVKPGKAPAVVIPYDLILKEYAEKLPSLPQPRNLDPDRRQAVKVIWTKNAEYGSVEFFSRYFGFIAKSDFLMGGTGWTACNFDWIMKPKNFRKIIESTYHKETGNA